MGIYADNGSINVTVVDGSSYTGIYAADGSFNVVQSDGSSYVGSIHPCGALWVTVSPGTLVPLRAPDGSLYVNENGSVGDNTGTPITVVGGSFSGGGNLMWSTSNLLWSTDHITWS